jgi:hypothetical protein
MLADLYVLAPTRSEDLVKHFIAKFLPENQPAALEYEVPQYATRPEFVLNSQNELITLCVSHPHFQHAIYWNGRNPGGDVRSAHVFFLPDGGMVLGVSLPVPEPVKLHRLLKEMQTFVGSEIGYATIEEPPPGTTAEVTRLAALWNAEMERHQAR